MDKTERVKRLTEEFEELMPPKNYRSRKFKFKFNNKIHEFTYEFRRNGDIFEVFNKDKSIITSSFKYKHAVIDYKLIVIEMTFLKELKLLKQ